ncbi:MAG: pilus assembly protein PilM [Sedimentisphaerales bacterium]|nr:pilus assembly protein PilM [Sedimentisphaerales bacterium]
MKFGDKTAVGIDISQDRISIVLLKNGKDGPELVKSAVAPVPEGAVKDGNIADAVLLSRAIRELKVRNRMLRTKRAAVSLFAKPVVTQIIDMPKQVPSNIRQFVDNEVKHCVALPSRDIALDFCGIGSTRRTADKRVLAVAAESARMVELVRVCSRAGFSVEAIEPPLLAYLRAIYEQRVIGKSGWNVLVAMLRGTALTLCVLKNGSVDFIRAKEFTSSAQEESQDACPAFGKAWDAKVEECQDCAEVYPDEYDECKKLTLERRDDSDDLNIWLADELSEVLRFYDIEVPENTGKWEITLFVDSPLRLDSGQASSPRVDAAPPLLSSDRKTRGPRGLEECLKSKIQSVLRSGSRFAAAAANDETGHLQVRTTEDAYMDTPLGGSAAGKDKQPSPVAVGLAMNLLTAQRDDVRINLVPPQVVRVREVKRDALIAANAVAVMLLIMVLTIHAFDFMIERINRSAVAKKQLTTGQDTEVMLEQHQRLDAKLKILTARLDRIAQISASHRDVNWAEVFDDIRKATPASVRITGLSCQDGARMLIDGLALSNEAFNSFVNSLEKSNNIASVVLLEARKQDGQNGLIVYQLSCKFGIRSGKVDNVG